MGAVDALDCGEGGGASSSSPTAAAAAATTAIARCPTAGGVAMMTGGPGDGDGDVKALAVRVKDC